MMAVLPKTIKPLPNMPKVKIKGHLLNDYKLNELSFHVTIVPTRSR